MSLVVLATYPWFVSRQDLRHQCPVNQFPSTRKPPPLILARTSQFARHPAGAQLAEVCTAAMRPNSTQEVNLGRGLWNEQGHPP
jgi:hypothetical protein